MRSFFAATALAGFAVLAAAGAAQAGNINVMNGQPVWQTGCTEPMAPPSVYAAGSNADADNVNARMTAYNVYAGQMQDFMNCVSNESQNDAAATSQSIAANAQTIIDTAQAKVRAAGVRAEQRPSED